MKQVFVFMAVLSMWLSAYSQERLLSMRIIYEVPIMQAKVGSSQVRDSVVYDYLVDKRFWWQTIDFVNAAAKDKKLFFLNDKGDSLNYDTVMCALTTAFGKVYGRTCTKEEVQRLIEEEVRAIKFKEQWFYDRENTGQESMKSAFSDIMPEDIIAIRIGEGWDIDRRSLNIRKRIYFYLPLYRYDDERFRQLGIRVYNGEAGH